MEIIGRNNVQEWLLDEPTHNKFLNTNFIFFDTIANWELNHPSHSVKLCPSVTNIGGKYLALEAVGESTEEVRQVNAIIEEHYQPFLISS